MDYKDILSYVKEEKILFIRLQFSDINGNLKNVEIPSQELERAFERGIMFDGSSIEGFARIEESDMYLRPDPNTFAVLPWSTDGMKSARLICDVYTPADEPFEGDPRYRLKLIVEKARKMGFEPYAGPELEFFILPRDEKGYPKAEFLDKGSYFDLLPLNEVESLRSEAAVALRTMGINVEATHHEVSPSQHELDFRYGPVLVTADNVQTVKLVLKTIAVKHNLRVTFMPKPFFGINGSGMHTHMSLFKGDENVFYDPNSSDGLSQTMKYFIGGLLKYARQITLVTNPTVNSYKRLVPGYEAPVNIAWSKANRTALIRIPAARGKSTRLEYRAPDPTCNAYLAFAVLFAAGLKGIEEKIEPPAPIEENIYHMSEERKSLFKIDSLPGSLREAIEEARNSELVKEVLGDHIFKKLIDLKRREWRDFSIAVTDWEREKYLNC
ncbi:type I glutamate--ammonia ligase [Pseudothermotoga thermarum]|uniref:Glutamine synthetase n=1 Tax=Pseudothermotoga thermarum DSM 5069 TaxID=688269 RepID=F7YVU8_9THEM|nr:type I glutamate--ammonia ligase [Pseudothermotoga thermarum]AEH51770.1 L-glutamine synthetase [Pseudothermotoga thermarum DSM 5069]